MFYNCTMHNQKKLNEDLEETVEKKPRLSPVEDTSDSREVKQAVRKAIQDIPKNEKVIIGGLGQFQVLITQLTRTMGWELYFVDMDFSGGSPTPQGLIPAPFWSREEKFEIGNNI